MLELYIGFTTVKSGNFLYLKLTYLCKQCTINRQKIWNVSVWLIKTSKYSESHLLNDDEAAVVHVLCFCLNCFVNNK